MWTYKEHCTFTVVECGIKSNLPSGAGCLQMHFCFASLLRHSVCHCTSVCYCLMDIYVPSGTYFHLICHTWGPHNLKSHIQSVSTANSDRFSFGHSGWLGDAISKQGSFYLNMQQLWALEPIWNNGNHFLSESQWVHSYLFWLLSCQVRVKQAWQGFVQYY